MFSFFFTSPDLIDYDFQLRYPQQWLNFKATWAFYSPHIYSIFKKTKGPTFYDLPEVDDMLPTIKQFFYLLNILPQTAAGKSSAHIKSEPFLTAIKKIIVFKKLNLPKEDLLEPGFRHPYLIADGENKVDISNFYLSIESLLSKIAFK